MSEAPTGFCSGCGIGEFHDRDTCVHCGENVVSVGPLLPPIQCAESRDVPINLSDRRISYEILQKVKKQVSRAKIEYIGDPEEAIKAGMGTPGWCASYDDKFCHGYTEASAKEGLWTILFNDYCQKLQAAGSLS